jgi:hypothetical protein
MNAMTLSADSLHRSASASASASASVLSDVYDAEMRDALRALAARFHRIEDIASLFLHGGKGVALGVGDGAVSARILDASKIDCLYAIAPWSDEQGQGVAHYRRAIMTLSPHRARTMILRMEEQDALPLFADGALDFVYLHSHAHDGLRDAALLKLWLVKARAGAIIAGDHYAPRWPRAMAAVDRFVEAHGLDLHRVECRDADGQAQPAAWFAMKP